MQRLWRDIDRSRDQLGLGGGASANGTSSWWGWAAALLDEAGLADAPAVARSILTRLPGGGVCLGLTAGALGLARRLPIIGAVVDLLPFGGGGAPEDRERER
jgi:hypothetical protein